MYPNPHERMKSICNSSSTMPNLLWISKHQQQHPSTYAHPLKNTIRVDSRGIRYKFDGKQWRPLCESPDGYECRNVAFRSSLCQKHFYKLNVYKRPYHKHPTNSPSTPAERAESRNDGDDDDAIEVIEHHSSDKEHEVSQQSSYDYRFFSIDCDPNDEPNKSEMMKNSLVTGTEISDQRRNSNTTESIPSNDSSVFLSSIPRITESIHLGLPPLTRTEEKSLANEMIARLTNEISLTMAEQWTRRRACEIVQDNYSHRLLPHQIAIEWFYDFLLRNPRVPIHFHQWFSSVPSHLPLSDQLLDIKMWELGLITRAIVSTSLPTTPPSSASSSN